MNKSPEATTYNRHNNLLRRALGGIANFASRFLGKNEQRTGSDPVISRRLVWAKRAIDRDSGHAGVLARLQTRALQRPVSSGMDHPLSRLENQESYKIGGGLASQTPRWSPSFRSFEGFDGQGATSPLSRGEVVSGVELRRHTQVGIANPRVRSDAVIVEIWTISSIDRIKFCLGAAGEQLYTGTRFTLDGQRQINERQDLEVDAETANQVVTFIEDLYNTTAY